MTVGQLAAASEYSVLPWEISSLDVPAPFGPPSFGAESMVFSLCYAHVRAAWPIFVSHSYRLDFFLELPRAAPRTCPELAWTYFVEFLT